MIGDAARDRIHLVSAGASGGVSSLDLSDSVAGPQGIIHLARTPGGSTAMAVHASGRATIVDLKSKTILGRLMLPGRHERIFPTVNSQYFLVPNLGDHTVSIISTWTHAESDRLRMRGDPADLYTLLGDTVLFAIDRQRPMVDVYDLDRRRPLKHISLPGKPTMTAAGPGGLKIYMALDWRDALAVIDINSLHVSKMIEDIGLVPASIVSGGGLSYCH